MVDAARKALHERRIGHTGTLDPFASGLLLLCVGRWTRLASFLTGMDKTYEAVARLGVSTDSEDRDGKVVEESDAWQDVRRDDVEHHLAAFRGEILQTPPRFSAKKVAGVAAHRRARRGEEVELTPRPVTIHELEAVAFDPPDLRLRVRCSSGTYVRSLARDLGAALGVGAHLVGLRRTAIGSMFVADAVALDELTDPGLDPGQVVSVGHGRPAPAQGMWAQGPVVASHGESLVAIGEVNASDFLPKKVFTRE
jgi:tRNA pseudouridine55 synthase